MRILDYKTVKILFYKTPACSCTFFGYGKSFDYGKCYLAVCHLPVTTFSFLISMLGSERSLTNH